MAKWGEGDPRWIVEERPDATNVNNWHWTEKNATPWSKERLQQLFTNFAIEQNDIVCRVDSIEKCTGEATANNRKGKLIFFYEWELELKWSGQLMNCSQISHNGKLLIPNLSEENDLNDIEVTVTIDESNDESESLKQFMYNIGRDKIRAQLGQYVKELKEEYSKNLILPKKGDETSANCANTTPTTTTADVNAKSNNLTTTTTTTSANSNNADSQQTKESGVGGALGCKLDVRTLTMKVEFQCRASDLYNALTKTEMVSAFTRAPAKVDAFKGGEFILYCGSVSGKFEELVPEKKICQSWRLKSWPSGHYSNVVIELSETKNCTNMNLKQTGIPASEYDAMKKNWQRYYWHSIKQTFAFGAALADAL